MSNQPFFHALNPINSAHVQRSAFDELGLELLSAYFLQLRALLDHEQDPALIVDARSGYILSINLPAFEQFGMDVVGFSLLDFMQVPDAYSQIIHCSPSKRGTQLTTMVHNADGQVRTCKVVVSVASDYTQWLLIRFTEKLDLPDHSDSDR